MHLHVIIGTYAPPGIPGADVGERRGICSQNLFRRVGT